MARMKSTTMSTEQIELWEAPSIASQLPIAFKTGFTFSGMRGCCAQCNGPIVDELFKGRVQRPTPHVAEVFAVGYCEQCEILTPFRYRVYDDQRFMGLRNDGWHEWKMKKTADHQTGIRHRIGRAVRWLFTF